MIISYKCREIEIKNKLEVSWHSNGIWDISQGLNGVNGRVSLPWCEFDNVFENLG
jgi:hypothetical protein